MARPRKPDDQVTPAALRKRRSRQRQRLLRETPDANGEFFSDRLKRARQDPKFQIALEKMVSDWEAPKSKIAMAAEILNLHRFAGRCDWFVVPPALNSPDGDIGFISAVGGSIIFPEDAYRLVAGLGGSEHCETCEENAGKWNPLTVSKKKAE